MPRTLLIDAVKAADQDAIQRRIDAGDDIDERDVFGKTPLTHAAERGDAGLVAWLLDRGAAINAAQYPPDHGTPLELAIGGGHAHVVDLLLARGANASGSMLNYAAFNGQLAIVNALLDYGSPVTRSPNGGTALLSLCGFGSQHARPLPAEPVCRTLVRLLAAGADLNGEDEQRATPLLAAVRTDNVPVVELLLQRGADPNLPEGPMTVLTSARDGAMVERLLQAGIEESGRRAAFWHHVHRSRRDLAAAIARTLSVPERDALVAGLTLLDAIRRSDAATLRRLIGDAADAAVPGPFRELALLDAVQIYRPEERRALTDVLLAAGVNPNTCVHASTPLVAAVVAKDVALVRRLVEAGADPNFRPENGDSALMAAVGSGEFWNDRLGPATRFEPAVDELTRILLEAGADVNVRGYEGRTALVYAIGRYPHNLERLLDAGADVNLAANDGWGPLMAADERVTRRLLKAGADVNARTRAGQTPLHLCTTLAKARLLVDHGADPNALDHAGHAPLFAHTQFGRADLVEWLAPLTADLDAAPDQKSRALLMAALLGHENIFKLLAAGGAKIDVQNEAGVNVLIGASRAGKPRLAQYALDHGVPVDHADAEGGTALMSAAAGGGEEIVRLLLARGATLNLRDARGRTALQLALISGRENTAKLLLDAEADWTP